MSKLAGNGDGGKTDEYGTLLVQQRLFTGEVAEGCAVVAYASPDMGVRVQAGTMRIPTGTAPSNYWYEAWIDTASPGEALTVTTANPSNPRRDFVVAYIDKGVTRSTSFTNNSNSVLKLAVVAGTPASSPSDPSGAQITTAIGASNPYIILARIAVGTGVTQITNSDITDLRQMMTIAPNQIAGGNANMLGAWQSWTPTRSNITIGNGTETARYIQIGKTVHFSYIFTLGSTSAIGSGPNTITLPVAPHSRYLVADIRIAEVQLLDAVNASVDGALENSLGTNNFVIRALNAGVSYGRYDNLSATIPFSWGTGDSIAIFGSYEAA